MCFVELLIAVLGVVVFCLTVIRIGDQECRGVVKNLIGAVLVFQMVFCYGFWFAVGFDEGLKAAKAGRSQPNMAAAERLHEKYQWVEVCVPFGSLCLAGLLLYAGLKDPQDDEPGWKRRHRERMHDEAFGEDDDDPLGRRYDRRRGDY